jgi:hypothetical protein
VHDGGEEEEAEADAQWSRGRKKTGCVIPYHATSREVGRPIKFAKFEHDSTLLTRRITPS